MKKALNPFGFILGFVLVYCGLSLLPACSSPSAPPSTTGTSTTIVVNTNKPIIVAAITSGAEIATATGLRTLAKTNAPAAAETATALKASITTNLMPYIQGSGTAVTSGVIQSLLNSSLFTGVNPTIRQAIAVAGSLLDAYLPPPGATSYLTADQQDYVVAFLTGIAKGCNDFQAKAVFTNEERWIRAE